MKKSAPSAKKAKRQSTAKKSAAPGAKLRIVSPKLPEFEPIRAASFAPLTVTAGAMPAVQTIIYVHGIGNKPPASVLKCQWDSALFGVELGDRSRLAYWVNREYYPTPADETCAQEDVVRIDDDEITTRSIMALATRTPTDEDEALDAEIDALAVDAVEREWLAALAQKLKRREQPEASGMRAAGYQAKILDLLPGSWRRFITGKLTRAFLRDVHDFFFVPERRKKMEQSLLDRLVVGGGPFVVIGHSQGSMIAYSVLRTLKKAACDVRLFVTIGSPLGLTEVQDFLRTENGTLPVPECVDRWINAADPLDPVAADTTLADEYSPRNKVEDFLEINPDSPRHPHSGSGYLKTRSVQEAVQRTVGNAFPQAVGQAVIAKDLVQTMEDGYQHTRHPALIALSLRPGISTSSIEVVGEGIIEAITAMVKKSNDKVEEAEIEPLKRYVAAKLTRFEIEQLRTRFNDLRIERVWRDATKRALICDSTNTVQASPANRGYHATGQGIGWAVLDTGIRADHPHFLKYRNIKRQWDCTNPGTPREFKPEDEGFGNLDRQGHGTHVAGIIAGELLVALRPDEPERLFAGMAPETELYGFKVLDDRGNGQDSWIIKALDLIADLNAAAGRLLIAGVNLSLGGNFDPSVYGCGHTPLCAELRRLWNQGVLVCLAAGNEGYALLQSAHGQVPSNLDLSIGDPANLEEAIAVGSIHKTRPHTYGISYFSSRGPTADGRRKPDLVAPGEQILSALHTFDAQKVQPGQKLQLTEDATASDFYVEMSGTSMAAPHVSGLLAAFISLRREFIGYPDRVKQILLANCTDLGRDPYIQGRGMPNLIKMLANS